MKMKELKPLDEYSEPVCRCESPGTVQLPGDQKLEIKVRGQDSDLVKEYMKNVRISFVVLSEAENAGTWDEEAREAG